MYGTDDREAIMSTPTSPPPEPGTHCEWCGAEYTADTPPQFVAPPTKPARQATDDEPATHCLWCGAPYGEPGEE